LYYSFSWNHPSSVHPTSRQQKENMPLSVYLPSWYAALVLTSLVMLNLKEKDGQGTNVVDHIRRHSKQHRTWPIRAFCLLIRLVDPIACWWVLQSKKGTASSATSGGNNQTLNKKDWLLVTSMVTIGALRHSFWGLYSCEQEEWTWNLALIASPSNNWFGYMHAKCRLSSPYQDIGIMTVVGAVIFAVGSVLETTSEMQQKTFKNRPENEGKLYTESLFRYARHINYTGYTLWRTGLGLVSGSPYTLAYGATHAFDFYNRAILMIADYVYMKEKYGNAWNKYTKDTPYKMIPDIY
jgi:protein-S-isoprenylcysteine O-methyltransferase Ste14